MTRTEVEGKLLEPSDIAWLVAFRVLLGVILAISMERYLAYGWVDELLLEPSFRFKYWGFEWVEPLPRSQMFWLFRSLVALGLCVSAGFCFRVTAPLFALGLTYVQLIDVSTYLNHYYLAALLSWLLAISPAHRAGSIDAWLRDRWRCRAGGARAPWSWRQIPVGWHLLFRVQVGVVYFFAGLAKLQSDWLIHAQPLRIWLGMSTDLPLLGGLFTVEGVPLLMSWCGFLFDATIVFWLLYPKTRVVAYCVVLLFHAFTRLLFDIGMFPWIMSAAALVFFPANWPRALLLRVGLLKRPLAQRSPVDRSAQDSERGRSTKTSPSWGARSVLVLGLLYCSVQVALPLRHWFYGGNVLWHEQGMRFSWRVMLRAKGGAVTFIVTEKDSGRVRHVNPEHYLTAFQENEMSGQPDLILQMAHWIARDFEARGSGPVEVRAETRVSLNGRKALPLVDPTVDLSQVRDGLGCASWVLPAPESAPPHIRPVL